MIVTNPSACPQNHPCPAVHRCPTGAIVQESRFSAPHVDRQLCTECGLCRTICRVFTHFADEAEVH